MSNFDGHPFSEEEFVRNLIQDLERQGAEDVEITNIFATEDEVVALFTTSNYGSGHYGMVKSEKWEEEYGAN